MNYKTFASGFLLVGGLLVASSSQSQVERDDRPDLIVSDLRHEGDMLVLEIQNQGPGAARGTITASVRGSGMRQPRTDSRKDVQVEAPRATRATVTHRIPLAEFGIPANGEFSMMFYYRFGVPPGNTEQSTGGITLGLVGIERGTEVSVKATIDWEGRVRETDESNNQFSKRVKILPEEPR